MSFSTFKQIISSLEPGISNNYLLEVFKKALIFESNEDDIDFISGETFRQIINDYKIGGVGRLMLSDWFNKL